MRVPPWKVSVSPHLASIGRGEVEGEYAVLVPGYRGRARPGLL
jgi:hypothetical protein